MSSEAILSVYSGSESKKLQYLESVQRSMSESPTTVKSYAKSDYNNTNVDNSPSDYSDLGNSLETVYPQNVDKITIQTNPLFTTMTGHVFLKMRRGSIDANTVRADSHKINLSDPIDLENMKRINMNDFDDYPKQNNAVTEDSDSSDLSQIIVEYEGHTDDNDGEPLKVKFLIEINILF